TNSALTGVSARLPVVRQEPPPAGPRSWRPNPTRGDDDGPTARLVVERADVDERPRRAPEREPVHTRRGGVVLPLVALIVGTAVGLVLFRPGGSTVDRPTATVPAPQGNTLVVVITNIRYDGESVTLTWVESSGGQASFVITQMAEDGTGVPVR